ncbi:hypothetical protein H310_07180 [Aphanomyces invadans]|uniref:Kinesin-like protein n=1 Tax=Aphanomyces invadans TaxID=157072 RepID=A0A024U4R1_9STRA|nr:hypothetical protein H310_07180 [Aphanomyces invadans]ETW00608.1 hypothetical protein H310_07180 [Aphanomyces invadans]|eukprot:XP_008870743.1 hypothetical protein H310_07180 [Aphanomyces invadans]
MATTSCVQVSCRFRGSPDIDTEAAAAPWLDFPDPHTVLVSHAKGHASRHSSFARVFSGEATQDQVFEHVGAPVVNDLLLGYNYTVLAYGQTGSGKTHTIVGSKTDPGLLPRLVQRVFDSISELGEEEAIAVTTSCFEVYQERIGDLLTPSNVSLRVREDKEKGIWVEGATDLAVTSTAAAMKAIQRSIANRSTGGHLMNAESSRSHCIFVLTITRPTTAGLKQTGKLFVVDLAGSEVVRKTAATGKRLDEAKYINKSLTALGLVINALTDGKSKHVPYRDSKLTRLLQHSLGGNAKTHLVLTCSSSIDNLEETLSTIRFGSRAQHIQNAPHVNAEKNVSEYKQLLAEMERKVEALSQYVAQLSNSSAAGPTTCDRCRQQMNSPASDPPEQSQAASSSSPSAPHDDEAPPLCAVCHIASNDLILCDGNCGLFWHRACVTEPVRNDDNIDENHLEFYCPSCQHGIATDPGKAVQHEITCLKQALHLMKQERDEAAERANIDKHVYEFADLKKTDVHRQLADTIADQESRIQSLLEEHELMQRQVHESNQQCLAKDKDMLAIQRAHQVVLDQNQAELDIVRRTLDSYERDHERFLGQIHDLHIRLAAADARSREHQDKLEECRVALARRDEESTRVNRLAHSQSFPVLVKPTASSPPKLPLRPVTVVGSSNSSSSAGEDSRMHLQSRGNIQQWWSGPQDASGGAMATLCMKADDLVVHNNLADDIPPGDSSKPFKARLVGLLASLQEETDAFKDLGDKINQENSRQKTRQRTRRTRRLLPDLQASDEFIESVTGPQR